MGLVLASDAAAHCVSTDNSPHEELLHAGSTLPGGSGLVAEWGPRGLANPLGEGKPSEDPKAWKLAAGTTSLEFTRTSIAPGLFVIVPSTTTTGTVDVTDPSGVARAITFTSAPLPTLLPAPRVAALKRRVIKEPRGGTRAIAIAKLRGAPPDGAVALVAYVGNQAVAWADASAFDESGGIEIFHDAIPCWSQPNDAPAPRSGTKVQLAWLDKTGRLSKRSAAIAIK